MPFWMPFNLLSVRESEVEVSAISICLTLHLEMIFKIFYTK